MKPITRQQAIRIGKTERWRRWTPAFRARFQLANQYLCMPFAVFHESVEELLGRSVWTNEFIDPASLLAEADGAGGPKSFADVVNKLDAATLAKTVVVTVAEREEVDP